ncbi:efflux RND transporter permease subunit [Caulobacter sp. SLTY]|uniref:efflux RND transporter permease subunit n=1 Tax=Caulobacter sp. SLTY TaxID=2683262 RepID=UPI0023F10530|nr:efflux RND transporter permease subunit [Caulobacter sp. SLTY]
MLSRFFIERPIFAWVLAIIVMLAGALSILNLPIAQYPNIALPQVSISAVYPGASAKTVEDSVTQIVEQRMKGLDGLLYMSSTSDGSGAANTTLTFKAGTDPDIAQVQVQNKLSAATALLPTEVQQQGLTVSKSARNFMMVVGLFSPDGSKNSTDLGDYAAASLVDAISRVDGVGEVQLFGSQYAMRIWLEPVKMAAVGVTPADVSAAVRAQNAQVSAGQIGGPPTAQGAALNATITAQSRLNTPEQFREIVVKSAPDGSAVRLSDVARVELGADSYLSSSRFNGKPAAGFAIRLATGANALQTAERVEAELAVQAKTFPAGIDYAIGYDTSPFVKKSIEEVLKTLAEAMVLVFIVMFVFLQNWRATLIPAIAVPIVLLGTMAVLFTFGYSINTLTMFALVLAIGLLVDDAIVVVENVERLMSEEGLSPKEATKKSMGEITGALIGIAAVLSAVFVPMAFFGGSQGVIYRQFSVTLVTAMGLSVLVALILTPALCATLLKPVQKGHGYTEKGFFGWFNRNFNRGRDKYESFVGSMFGRTARYGLIFLGILVVMGVLFVRLPSSFLPPEDQGIMMVQVQLPAGSTQDQTLATLRKVENHFLVDEKDAVQSIFTVAGFSFSGAGQNAGIGFIRLKPFEDRGGKDLKAPAISDRAMAAFGQIREAMIFAIVPPAVPELGTSSGFDLQLKDVGGVGHEALMAARGQLLGMAGSDPNLQGVRPNGQDDTPQLKLTVDQAKAQALGLSISDINTSIASVLGGSYINDFVDRGRVKRVYMQSEAAYRSRPEDLAQIQLRNSAGQMVPLTAVAQTSWTYGPSRLERYNGVPAMNIQGAAAAGKSSGEAMAAMEAIIAKLPPGIGYEWSGLSLQERESGGQAPILYGLSILVVFLLLAALYESWTIPVSVVLAIPLGVLGAVLATTLRGLENDIYFQVGLLTTMGLAAKNAILIVEFAKEAQARGASLIDATLEAARLRLRPILMTSFAFMFGVLPLAISSGAGSGAQNAVGTGVIGGLLAAVVLGLIFVPLFYVTVQKTFTRKPKAAPVVAGEEGASA